MQIMKYHTTVFIILIEKTVNNNGYKKWICKDFPVIKFIFLRLDVD